MRVVAAVYKGLRVVTTPRHAPLTGLTTIHGPRNKNGDAAPKQILDTDLFRCFQITQKDLGPQTNAISFIMKLSFQPWVEHQKWSPDTSWVSVLLLAGPGLQNRLEVDSVWASSLTWAPVLVFHASKSSLMHPLVLSMIPKHNIIIR